MTWWERQKAKKIKSQLYLAVLRPTKKEGLPVYLSNLPSRIEAGLSSDQFNNELSAILGNRFIFCGYLRRGDKRIYSQDGTATGEDLQPGDVLDTVQELQRAIESGAYARA